MDRSFSASTMLPRIIVLVTFLIKVKAQDDPAVIGTRPTVNLENGTSGRLPCVFEADNYVVFWYKNNIHESSLLVFRDMYFNIGEKQGPGFVNRSFDISEESSLIIKSAGLHDTGQYICSVIDFDIGITHHNQTNVTVYVSPAQPYPNLQPCNKSLGINTDDNCTVSLRTIKVMNISCSVSGFYPSLALDFQYMARKVSPVDTQEWENADGTFGRSISIHAIPSSEPYRCFASVLSGKLAEQSSSVKIRHEPPLQTVAAQNRLQQIGIIVVLFTTSTIVPSIYFCTLCRSYGRQASQELADFEKRRVERRQARIEGPAQATGGVLSVEEARHEMERRNQQKKYENILKREQWQREKREREDKEIQQKIARAREKAKENERRRAERAASFLRNDHERKNEGFLQRLEASSSSNTRDLSPNTSQELLMLRDMFPRKDPAKLQQMLELTGGDVNKVIDLLQ